MSFTAFVAVSLAYRGLTWCSARTSFTANDQFDFGKAVGERDERFGVDSKQKAEKRSGIEEPAIHPDADTAWRA